MAGATIPCGKVVFITGAARGIGRDRRSAGRGAGAGRHR